MEKMRVKRVVSASLLRACRKFLAQNPIANILPLGDLYLPLFKASTLYSAIENNRVVGVCSVYRALSKLSVVLGTAMSEIKKALLQKALNEVSGEFISLCQPGEIKVFKEFATLMHVHPEHQMVADSPKRIKYDKVKVTRVHKDELKLLDKFYLEHHSEAWTPLQFKVGPFYCVKQEGTIVSAAGVHIVTPQIAQLGNIVTDEAYRNRGYATACTSALAAALASKKRIISLFVRTDNTPAIRIYEKLGFIRQREIDFVIMRKDV